MLEINTHWDDGHSHLYVSITQENGFSLKFTGDSIEERIQITKASAQGLVDAINKAVSNKKSGEFSVQTAKFIIKKTLPLIYRFSYETADETVSWFMFIGRFRLLNLAKKLKEYFKL